MTVQVCDAANPLMFQAYAEAPAVELCSALWRGEKGIREPDTAGPSDPPSGRSSASAPDGCTRHSREVPVLWSLALPCPCDRAPLGLCLRHAPSLRLDRPDTPPGGGASGDGTDPTMRRWRGLSRVWCAVGPWPSTAVVVDPWRTLWCGRRHTGCEGAVAPAVTTAVRGRHGGDTVCCCRLTAVRDGPARRRQTRGVGEPAGTA